MTSNDVTSVTNIYSNTHSNISLSSISVTDTNDTISTGVTLSTDDVTFGVTPDSDTSQGSMMTGTSTSQSISSLATNVNTSDVSTAFNISFWTTSSTNTSTLGDITHSSVDDTTEGTGSSATQQSNHTSTVSPLYTETGTLSHEYNDTSTVSHSISDISTISLNYTDTEYNDTSTAAQNTSQANTDRSTVSQANTDMSTVPQTYDDSSTVSQANADTSTVSQAHFKSSTVSQANNDTSTVSQDYTDMITVSATYNISDGYKDNSSLSMFNTTGTTSTWPGTTGDEDVKSTTDTYSTIAKIYSETSTGDEPVSDTRFATGVGTSTSSDRRTSMSAGEIGASTQSPLTHTTPGELSKLTLSTVNTQTSPDTDDTSNNAVHTTASSVTATKQTQHEVEPTTRHQSIFTNPDVTSAFSISMVTGENNNVTCHFESVLPQVPLQYCQILIRAEM